MDGCTVCQGTGWEMVARQGRPLARRCACGRLARLIRLKDDARLPQRYERCSLDGYVPLNPSQARALAEARKFVERFPDAPGLFFVGPSGVGKTHLAVGILRVVAQRSRGDVLFSEFEGMFAASPDDEASQGRRGRMQKCQFLVLDNFGAAPATLYNLQFVQELVHERIRERRPTVFTSTLLRSGDANAEGVRIEAFFRCLEPVLLTGGTNDLRSIRISGHDFRRELSCEAPLF
jgi:DNA replication protein DnaC